ncbi:MAG: DnaJ domain-containing protein [Acidobacteriia bacterium]|nr:DnaJ domain-containing protein [Terriglobia bacterium]
MSAPLAGKFQDHYKVLDIEPRSNLETIHQAYGKLVEKYHPRNAKTGDQAKFDSINLAYEVLCDPTLRESFDKLKGVGEDKAEFKFSGLDFFAALGRETALRAALLCILYDRRRLKPFTPGLSMRMVENMLETTSEGLNFALWYLKQRNLAISDDKSNLMISAEGMDYLETNPPTPEMVMPLIKAAGLASPQTGPLAEAEAAAEPALTGTGPSNVKRIFEALSRT